MFTFTTYPPILNMLCLAIWRQTHWDEEVYVLFTLHGTTRHDTSRHDRIFSYGLYIFEFVLVSHRKLATKTESLGLKEMNILSVCAYHCILLPGSVNTCSVHDDSKKFLMCSSISSVKNIQYYLFILNVDREKVIELFELSDLSDSRHSDNVHKKTFGNS